MSAARFAQLPEDSVPEAAFVGRSNAGKSSAMNAICQQKSLARVSKTPGRTQLINLFDLQNARLVDLPGYGFAQVPIKVRDAWGALVGGYVQKRETLRGLIVVMDIRHPLTELDVQMLEWCRGRGLKAHVLLTKADKLSFGAAKNTLLAVTAELAAFDASMSAQTFSSPDRIGLDVARAKLTEWLQLQPPVVGIAAESLAE
ncbi:MAG: ribosome biogenesis GTP-binding protein YihA/YsxC [Nevskia sp.]|jgi:GTP-binding protein|nr:ribosome biogenesis GTP-binding protein YihA/YsxC [Nevskia sp.]MCK9386390.1 ribosome biogenesis GTP-binding protein YihA/YsxC [Nevskia sp.]